MYMIGSIFHIIIPFNICVQLQVQMNRRPFAGQKSNKASEYEWSSVDVETCPSSVCAPSSVASLQDIWSSASLSLLQCVSEDHVYLLSVTHSHSQHDLNCRCKLGFARDLFSHFYCIAIKNISSDLLSWCLLVLEYLNIFRVFFNGNTD